MYVRTYMFCKTRNKKSAGPAGPKIPHVSHAGGSVCTMYVRTYMYILQSNHTSYMYQEVFSLYEKTPPSSSLPPNKVECAIDPTSATGCSNLRPDSRRRYISLSKSRINAPRARSHGHRHVPPTQLQLQLPM